MGVESRRLFFALWPDGPNVAALNKAGLECHKRCGGRIMRRETLHMTLAFLGDVEENRIQPLVQLAAAIVLPAFHFKVDRLSHWEHNHIVWAGCSDPPDVLLEFGRTVRDGVRESGFHIDANAFTPHVTLLRNVRRSAPLPDLPAIEWPVAEFALVESLRSAEGARYLPLSCWPLGAAIG